MLYEDHNYFRGQFYMGLNLAVFGKKTPYLGRQLLGSPQNVTPHYPIPISLFWCHIVTAHDRITF